MKWTSLIMALSFLSALALAQVESVDLSGELSNELNALDAAPSQLPAKVNSGRDSALTTSSTNVTIQNRNSAVEELPATYVQASPLTESKAEKLRRHREAAELNTEMMIVEQLERDRIQSERDRAKRLFGNKLENDQQANQYQQAQPVHQPIQEDDDLKKEISEIKTLLSEKEKKEEYVEEKPVKVKSSYAYEPESAYTDSKFTMSVSAGAGSYPGVSNVDGVFNLGFAVGMEFNEGLIVEAMYENASYDVDSIQGTRVELTENVISGVLKYRVLNTRVAPVVGTIVSYTLRDYDDRFYNISASSQALDLGLMIGADVKVSHAFNVGLDLKYLFNITNRIDNEPPVTGFNSYNSFYSINRIPGGTPIEELERMIIGVNARLNF